MAVSSFDPNHTGMLSMDLHSGIVSIYTRDLELVTLAGELLRDAREAGLTIIHIQVSLSCHKDTQKVQKG